MDNQERIIVLYKPHGTKVSIMKKQFDPQCHELIEDTPSKALKTPKQVDIPKTEEKPPKAVKTPPVDRLEELKAIGWAKLNGDQRKEYKKLNDR